MCFFMCKNLDIATLLPLNNKNVGKIKLLKYFFNFF